MKRYKLPSILPVSQRDLAAYLGVSVSTISMEKTGKHGKRQFSPAVSLKMSKLVNAYKLFDATSPGSSSLTKMKDASAQQYSRLAKSMIEEANFLDLQVKVVKNELDKMLKTEEDGERWMKTIERLLSSLPDAEESGKDRQWLEHQHAITLSRVQKNGWLAQLKLETQIETKKARARVYKAAHQKLVSRMQEGKGGIVEL